MPPSPDVKRSWPRLAASAAIFRGREVLLVERGKGQLRGLWSLPGGHVEPGEPARAAALREVEEETGVAADIHGLLDINDVILKDEAGTLRAHYLIAVFFGHWLSGEPVAGGDAAQARFVPFDSLGTLRMTDGLPEYIDRAWARLGTPEARAKP